MQYPRPGQQQAGYPPAHSLVPAPSPRPRPEGGPGRGRRTSGRRGVSALSCLWQAAVPGPSVTAPAGRSCDRAILAATLTAVSPTSMPGKSIHFQVMLISGCLLVLCRPIQTAKGVVGVQENRRGVRQIR